MKLAFRIALRFLSSNKGQTLLIALGIAIGISVQIFIGSLIEGLQISLVDATIGRSPHITLSSAEKNEPLDGLSSLERDLLSDFPEISKITPTLTKGAFIKKGDNTAQVLFRGFELSQADALYQFSEGLSPGSALPIGTNEVLLGIELGKENAIQIGDVIEILSPDNAPYEVVVSGFFDLKVSAINTSWVIGAMPLSRSIFGYSDDQGTAIELQIEMPFSADATAIEIEKRLNQSIKVTEWKAANEQLLSGLTGQSTSSLMIQVFVVISVVLGIASVLAITVVQKSKQIGILKAMGIKDKVASGVFLFQGFMLGILGGLLGIVFGIGLLYAFSTFALNPDGSPVVPIFINPMFIGFSGLIAVTASTAASIIPALNSKKLTPIEVIRNG